MTDKDELFLDWYENGAPYPLDEDIYDTHDMMTGKEVRLLRRLDMPVTERNPEGEQWYLTGKTKGVGKDMNWEVEVPNYHPDGSAQYKYMAASTLHLVDAKSK